VTLWNFTTGSGSGDHAENRFAVANSNVRFLVENYNNFADLIATQYTGAMTAFSAMLAALALTDVASAQHGVSFPSQDGGVVYGDLYGKADHAIVLAHGAVFNKESWAPQARALAAAGFCVLAIDFRGYGQSRGPGQDNPLGAPLYLDVLAAVRYLRTHGAKSVSVVGASMGGAAAGDASIASEPGEIDRLVLLAASPTGPAEKLKSPTLFIVAHDDASGAGPRLPGIRAKYEKAPEPKELIITDGSAHAQFLFKTDQGERVMREILRFLSAR
jgi:pimeloyl-ACP methyl ester carboxylesterase